MHRWYATLCQGLVNCTSRFLQWTQSLVMRCYDMYWNSIDMLCSCKSADPTCGFVKSPWDSIAMTESGHVSSLPFHVSLHLQCRCWIVLRIVKVSTSRCRQGWCTFLAAAPGSNNFHPWLTVIQFTGKVPTFWIIRLSACAIFDAWSFFAVLETCLGKPILGRSSPRSSSSSRKRGMGQDSPSPLRNGRQRNISATYSDHPMWQEVRPQNMSW